jgi:hypothetical protein
MLLIADCSFELSNKHASRLIAAAFRFSLTVACVVCELRGDQCGSFAHQSNRATLRNSFPSDFSYGLRTRDRWTERVLADIVIKFCFRRSPQSQLLSEVASGEFSLYFLCLK